MLMSMEDLMEITKSRVTRNSWGKRDVLMIVSDNEPYQTLLSSFLREGWCFCTGFDWLACCGNKKDNSKNFKDCKEKKRYNLTKYKITIEILSSIYTIYIDIKLENIVIRIKVIYSTKLIYFNCCIWIYRC